ncbi:MAG: 50S ribosomal protein L39e [Candidatus Micrarchaeota archaeon]|nr:50S ribosomal protein L39e [Candidatus Micrarchaeota archaeon]
MSKKSPIKKAKLGRAARQNRRVPIFVMAKTNRRVTQNTSRRSWRSQKLKMGSQKNRE